MTFFDKILQSSVVPPQVRFLDIFYKRLVVKGRGLSGADTGALTTE